MARVVGPGYMKGAVIPLRKPTECDGCGAPATISIVGESDSCGAEVSDLCAACFSNVKNSEREEASGLQVCELCQSSKDDCVNWRDPAEGLAGPVYLACKSCREAAESHILPDEDELENDDEDDDGY